MGRYALLIVRQVKTRLKYWEDQARSCGSIELRKQALESIRTKGFHCYGGSVFALCHPEHRGVLLDLIIAYQTLCDYLDNLCDRARYIDRLAFRRLHDSLLDALQPERRISDYYSSFIFKDDEGYIDKLVAACRDSIVRLPSYALTKSAVVKLATLYIDLQVLKHDERNVRESTLSAWASRNLAEYPSLQWQEFCAATGSTLGIFALFGLATADDVKSSSVERVTEIFFPWVCGLHILLDYIIDQEEDRIGGDLNFISYYISPDEITERLELFIERSLQKCRDYPHPLFLRTVIQGLLGMYLSDPKVCMQGFDRTARKLMAMSGNFTSGCFNFCLALRKLGYLHHAA
ncbi:MAG: tetraprenyl-beta-curcumene synthase family protein [Syntrophorhabdaceae bacterium]